jgi:hypothetical protein
MNEPMTEAGKRLAADICPSYQPCFGHQERIAAIEAEAAERALAGVRAETVGVLVNSGDFDRGIAAAESNRLTHVHWRDWRAKGHGTDEDHEMVGDQAHHEEAIAEYDVILRCLRAARVALVAAREAVKALPGECHDGEGLGCETDPCVENVSRAAVLRAMAS